MILGPSLGDVTLRSVEVSDAAYILGLRLDPVLSRYLSPVPPNVAVQEAWIAAYKERERLGVEYYFVIENLGTSVGTVRLYDFRGDSFSWGSWIVQPGLSPRIAFASAAMVYDFAFGELGFKRSHFSVMKENASVLRFHRRTGAVETASTGESIDFEITKEIYRVSRPWLVDLATPKCAGADRRDDRAGGT